MRVHVRLRHNRDDRFRRLDLWRHRSVAVGGDRRFWTFLLAPGGRTALIVSSDPVYGRSR